MIITKRVLIVCTFSVVLLISACAGNKDSNTEKPFSSGLNSNGPALINQLDAENGKEFITANAPFVLDVRTEQEYEAGHLENSYLLPVQVLQDQIGLLEKYKDKDIFVYCRSGSRSASASKILIDAGFTRVYNLQGGINGWIAAGNPVVK